MYNQWGDPLYGNFRSRTFADIFPDSKTFINEYNNNGIAAQLDTQNITTLYYLLYGQYGNSHIASSDENTFKYRVWSIIFMYGPAWQERLKLQQRMRGLSDEDIRSGSFAIHNHAYNPSVGPSTATLTELPAINEQNTTRYKKGIVDAYAQLWQLLDTDVTKYFLDRFRALFIKVVEPEYPLWYKTKLNQEDIINDDDGADN